jgi:hypothetical protein
MHEGPKVGHPPGNEQYARVESVILDLQLSISSVRRANGCLDLDTVQGIRGRAGRTLRNADRILSRFRADPSQARRVAERRGALVALLSEPAPIEHLAQTLRVGAVARLP